MALTACHDHEIIPQDNGGGEGQQTFINFATRAGSAWDDVLLPGQKFRAVIVNGKEMLVPQSIGIYGFLMNDDYTKVLDVDKQEFAVFDNDVLKEYDRPQNGGGGNNSDEVTEVTKPEMEAMQRDAWEALEVEEYGKVTNPETGARENLFPVDEGINIEGSITQPNGEVTDSTGNRTIIQTPGEEITDPDNPDNPDVTEPPYGTTIAADGTVELRDGTKITKDGIYRPYNYRYTNENNGTSEVSLYFYIYRSGNNIYEVREESGDKQSGISPDEIGVTTDADGTVHLPDGTTIYREKDTDATAVTYHNKAVVFTMSGVDDSNVQALIQVEIHCENNTLTFINGNDTIVLDLAKIQTPDNQTSDNQASGEQTSGDPITGGDGTETNPVRPRLATRATDIPIYDDEYDRYYWGYNAHRWTSGHYMFYAYSPASQHVDLDYNEDATDPAVKCTIGNFTWGKIPSISNTDYVVAKNEVWKYNDPTRVHFDAMDHLMSRIRVAFAVHPDFHKIRRVVVTNVSLTILEPGFNRIYEYSNHRADAANKDEGVETGINRISDGWRVWKENGQDFLYNPAKNPAAYADNVQEVPFDAVKYEGGGAKYGKLLYPLKTSGTWERSNLYNDFYIVPFANNEATQMTVCVEYDIYDTDVCDKDDKPIADKFTADHRIRHCKRISTLKFQDSAGNPKPIHFEKNQSRTLNILINPNYIYSLFDHDEPATMIVQ